MGKFIFVSIGNGSEKVLGPLTIVNREDRILINFLFTNRLLTEQVLVY